MNWKTALGRLRILAILEGISYLLFAITMPLKYGLNIPQPNFFVGMAHGWLFILYIVLCIQNIYLYRWKSTVAFLALAASLIPFGTFVADARISRKQQQT